MLTVMMCVSLFSLQDVTLDNVEEYIDLVMDFCFNSGIRRQMEAFRGWWHGFCPWIICLFIVFLVAGVMNKAGMFIKCTSTHESCRLSKFLIFCFLVGGQLTSSPQFTFN